MGEVTMRELRNQGAQALERVARGERLVVTRDGTPVAEVVPLRRRPAAREQLVARRRNLARIDLDELRSDLAGVLDERL